jgi:hypothetical protein
VLFDDTGADVTIWGEVEPEDVKTTFERLAEDESFPTTLEGDVRVLRPPEEGASQAA